MYITRHMYIYSYSEFYHVIWTEWSYVVMFALHNDNNKCRCCYWYCSLIVYYYCLSCIFLLLADMMLLLLLSLVLLLSLSFYSCYYHYWLRLLLLLSYACDIYSATCMILHKSNDHKVLYVIRYVYIYSYIPSIICYELKLGCFVSCLL